MRAVSFISCVRLVSSVRYVRNKNWTDYLYSISSSSCDLVRYIAKSVWDAWETNDIKWHKQKCFWNDLERQKSNTPLFNVNELIFQSKNPTARSALRTLSFGRKISARNWYNSVSSFLWNKFHWYKDKILVIRRFVSNFYSVQDTSFRNARKKWRWKTLFER